MARFITISKSHAWTQCCRCCKHLTMTCFPNVMLCGHTHAVSCSSSVCSDAVTSLCLYLAHVSVVRTKLLTPLIFVSLSRAMFLFKTIIEQVFNLDRTRSIPAMTCAVK